MKPRHQVSRAGLSLIKAFEGYRRSAARLADGRWTIGYGHTLSAREGAEVSEADAEALLMYDLLAVSAALDELTYTPITQNQFDALASFAYSVGVDAFRASNVLLLVNEGALLQAAHALEAWRKASFDGEEVVVDALVRRRAAEKALFLTPQGGFVAAPSAIVAPRLDADAVFAEVVDIHALLDGVDAIAIPRAVELGLAASSETQVELPIGPGVGDAQVAQAVEYQEAASNETDALQGVLSEVLYEIPGYNAEGEFQPAKGRFEALSVVQLSLMAAAGLGLLGGAVYLLLRAAVLSGILQLTFNGLAVLGGLAGAILTFIAVYQLLNRFDRES